MDKRTRQLKKDEFISALRRLEGFLEIVLLSVIFFLFWKEFFRYEGDNLFLGNGKYVLIGVYALLTFMLFHFSSSFKFGYLKLFDILIAQGLSIAGVNVITYFQLCLIANHMLEVVPMLLLTVADLFFVLLFSYGCTKLYRKIHEPRKLLLIYGDVNALTILSKINMRKDKYHIAHIMKASEDYESILKTIEDYDGIILSDIEATRRNDLLKYCYKNSIRVYVVPKLSDIIIDGAPDVDLFDTPLLLVKGRGLSFLQRFFKRFGDIIISLIVLIIFSPVLLIVSLLIKLEDHGPVFYTQDRVTKDQKVFKMIKFRSMVTDAEKYGAQPAVDHDPRITKIGRFIRATRIDEIPQVFNILKGDMSIVGPRPERVENVEAYTREIPEFVFRTKVKGGLTGYAQIYGKYNTSAYDKLRLDMMYIENYSIHLDLKLLLLTVQVMLKKESTEGFDQIQSLEELQRLEEKYNRDSN